MCMCTGLLVYVSCKRVLMCICKQLCLHLSFCIGIHGFLVSVHVCREYVPAENTHCVFISC